MPTHLSATNLSPIRARPAPSKVSTSSFPMVSGARGARWRRAGAEHSRGRGGQAPGPAPWMAPARPAPREPVRCPQRSRSPARPRPPPRVQGHFHARGPRNPLLAGLLFKAPRTERASPRDRSCGKNTPIRRWEDRGSLLLKAAKFNLSSSNEQNEQNGKPKGQERAGS